MAVRRQAPFQPRLRGAGAHPSFLRAKWGAQIGCFQMREKMANTEASRCWFVPRPAVRLR